MRPAACITLPLFCSALCAVTRVIAWHALSLRGYAPCFGHHLRVVLVLSYLPVLCAALSLTGLNFIKAFGFMGIPIFVSLAACNEVTFPASVGTSQLAVLLAAVSRVLGA